MFKITSFPEVILLYNSYAFKRTHQLTLVVYLVKNAKGRKNSVLFNYFNYF
ncbi:MAG: hypothetical protein UV40_C0016G0010 [Parcubacteria group bacterium GW2011_GWA1_42_7]|nr:MAG: hypothetical protein UV40_C0016G0010 [Parcubacteria group bacterium GW2011_GWA1_42_7]KKS92320.1 MAG: hypothetical protein UV67_C0006G0036 [Parcubacteria group bacterium GW2011_GWC1_43_12]